jgi:glycosyltransferase involved in cell wall biosynthesis
MALFTVVIPTYNRARFISKAIESVLRQDCNDWKLLIMDDASTDNTKEMLKMYLCHPQIQYFRMEQNSGISKVMNKALSLVDTPFMVQLDSDDWLPDWTLAILKEHITKDKKNTALFYGNIMIWRVHNMQYSDPYFVRHKQFRNKYKFLTYNKWMVAPRTYRVSALRKVGGWDTSDQFEGRIMEDRRIILRLIEKYPVKWIDRTLYNRTKHNGQLTDGHTRWKRNRLRKRTFEYYLKRWGRKYRAEYGRRKGYLMIKKLRKRKEAKRINE